MITIQLSPEFEQRLQQLAQSSGQESSAYARRVLEEFLAIQNWPKDQDRDWAESSVAMTPECFPHETWPSDEVGDGPR